MGLSTFLGSMTGVWFRGCVPSQDSVWIQRLCVYVYIYIYILDMVKFYDWLLTGAALWLTKTCFVVLWGPKMGFVWFCPCGGPPNPMVYQGFFIMFRIQTANFRGYITHPSLPHFHTNLKPDRVDDMSHEILYSIPFPIPRISLFCWLYPVRVSHRLPPGAAPTHRSRPGIGRRIWTRTGRRSGERSGSKAEPPRSKDRPFFYAEYRWYK